MSKFGRSESTWRDTSVVPPATNRCSIWSTILTCWSAHEKTIIPVAKIIYAYGAGAGTGGIGEKNTRGEGGGGGCGVRAVPVGVTEVSSQQTRFVPITD